MSENIHQHIYKFWLLSLIKNYKSFKQAASHANMTQSALSQNMTALEKVFQKTLLLRGRGRVELTEDGVKILSQIRPILTSIENLHLNHQELSSSIKKIRIGAYDSMANLFLPKFIEKMQHEYPEVKLDIQVDRTADLESKIRNGELDVALVVEPEESDRYHISVLGEDYLGVYISKNSITQSQSWTELIDEYGLGTISPGKKGYPRFYTKFMQQLEVNNPKMALTCDSFETLCNLSKQIPLPIILPARCVGHSHQDHLQELSSFQGTPKDPSLHRHCLISRKSLHGSVLKLIENEFKGVLI